MGIQLLSLVTAAVASALTAPSLFTSVRSGVCCSSLLEQAVCVNSARAIRDTKKWLRFIVGFVIDWVSFV